MEISIDTFKLLIPFFILSIIAFAIILERSFFFVKIYFKKNNKLLKELEKILFINKDKPKILRDELVTIMLDEIKKKYDFGIKILRLIALMSPMIGLLGTVIGIIKVFNKIAHTTEQISPSLVAEGLQTAMITTSIGLVIALPCLFAAFIFSRLSENKIFNLQHQLNKESLKIEGFKL